MARLLMSYIELERQNEIESQATASLRRDPSGSGLLLLSDSTSLTSLKSLHGLFAGATF
ncbi:MAG: hypothetical protein FWG02_07120 [Holophagaceae bacterium]|nr:hypothetical protein [Holophagaceae bacterium]